VREICNIAYYLIASKFQPPNSDDEPDIEEQLVQFEENIGQRVKAEVRANKLLRERLIVMGIDPDAKPELSPELAAKIEQDKARMETDEELMWNGTAWEGKEIRGKKIKNEGL
jgi:hypothetical protein